MATVARCTWLGDGQRARHDSTRRDSRNSNGWTTLGRHTWLQDRRATRTTRHHEIRCSGLGDKHAPQHGDGGGCTTVDGWGEDIATPHDRTRHSSSRVATWLEGGQRARLDTTRRQQVHTAARERHMQWLNARQRATIRRPQSGANGCAGTADAGWREDNAHDTLRRRRPRMQML